MKEKNILLKYASYFINCTPEGAAYGTCVSQNAEKIKKDACVKEFLAFKACIKKLKSKP